METFSRFLLALYRASRELPPEQFQDTALDLVKGLVPFDSSMWGSGVMGSTGLAIHSIHLHNQPLEFVNDYAEVKDQDWAAFDLWQHPNVTSTYHNPGWNRGRGRSGIRDFHKRFATQNAVIDTDFRSDTGFVQWISLYRAEAGRHYQESERTLTTLIGPHLREALTTNHLLYASTLRTSARDQPMGIVDMKGLIYHAEPAFYRLVLTEWPNWTRTAHVPPPLQAIIVGRQDHHVGRLIAVHRFRVRDLIFVRVQSRSAVDALTSRERTIALHLANGMNHKQVAKLLEIAPSTVRNHIQKIYSKLHIHSKAALYKHLSKTE